MRLLPERTSKSRMLVTILAGISLVTATAPLSARADTDLNVGGQAVIAYANGDHVRLRTGPGYDFDIIDLFSEGTSVDVLDGPVAADDGSYWYNVSVGGETGYIVSDWLASSSGLLSSVSGSAWTIDSVNVRTGPSTADDIATTLSSGAEVALTGDSSNGWLSVSVDGIAGWVYGAFLTQNADEAGSGTSSSSNGGGTMYTNDSVNLRTGPGLDWRVITELPAGATLWLTGNEVGGFAEVSSDYGDGWVFTDYLSSSPPDLSGSPSQNAGGTMYTNDSVNLRTGPSLDSTVITELPAGATVELTGAEKNGFAEASTDYGDGWIFTDYLSSSPPSKPASQPAEEAPAPAPVTSNGQKMVDFAMQFLGQPYVWAGNQPGGFDCSGLTQYVVANILGQEITHSTELQIGYGTPVDTGDLQPGDLVFFANTYAAGITHVGIYIGNGTFIHAENPGTGVVISDLNSSYYAEHYAGARRLT